MDKAPDAFRTISEVADDLDLPQHVLRFWESRFPQIRPVKRAGGRRYYRPADVALLTGIKHLLRDEGMTIRGVQKILREQGVSHVAGVLGLGVFSHEDDIGSQLSDAMALPGTDLDDDAERPWKPAFQAVESAQVVALETALQARRAAAPPAALAEPEPLDLDLSGLEVPPEPSFETLAQTLRLLPRPLPYPLRAKLAVQSGRLESLRDAMQAHSAGQ